MNSMQLLKALQQNKESFLNIDDIKKGKEVGIKKACPFCGSEEIVLVNYKHTAGIRCSVFCCGCAAGIDPGWAQENRYVVDMWNRRVN